MQEVVVGAQGATGTRLDILKVANSSLILINQHVGRSWREHIAELVLGTHQDCL